MRSSSRWPSPRFKLTPVEHREANGFSWEPIREVAILFAGIFLCIIPVLEMLKAGPGGPFPAC